MLFQAYHGVAATQHQMNFNKWSAQGYRMISLSVYGDSGNPLYAAVWVQRAGPAWAAIHGVDATGYQDFFSKSSKQGYYPVLVSATGESNDAVFASVFEQGDPGPMPVTPPVSNRAGSSGTLARAFPKEAETLRLPTAS